MTTLRNIVGGMDLEQTLTSREEINTGLRGVLDEATGKWGIRVNRVEIKGIDPPPSIKDSMEKQMRADRDKRALILTAEGQRQSAILTAEGTKQSAILNAEGDRESQILRAQADRESADPAGPGRGAGDPDRLPGDPRRPARPGAAGLPVPPDDAEDRRGRRQQGVGRPVRDHQGARGPGLRRSTRWPGSRKDADGRASGSTWAPRSRSSTRASDRRAERRQQGGPGGDRAAAEARPTRARDPARRPAGGGRPARRPAARRPGHAGSAVRPRVAARRPSRSCSPGSRRAPSTPWWGPAR